MTKKLTVCFVTEDFYPSFIGGQGVWGKELVHHLARQGTSITVLAEHRSGRSAYWQKRKDVRLILAPFCFGNQLALALFHYLSFLWHLGGSRIDVVHANQLTGLFFVLFRPQNVGAIVVSMHNTYDQMAAAAPTLMKKIRYKPLIVLEKIVYEKADGIAYHTESEHAYGQRAYEISSKPFCIAPVGAPRVNLSGKQRRNFQKSIRTSLSLPANARIVLYVGRLVQRKRVDDLIAALRLLAQARPPVVGVIVGSGVFRQQLEKRAGPNVRFVGFAEATEPYFAAGDVFVTTSVAEGGVLLTATEAAAYGLPLILSPDTADPQIFRDGVNGMAVMSQDPGGLARAIQQCLRNKRTMGQESKKFARRLSWLRCASRVNGFYRSLLERD